MVTLSKEQLTTKKRENKFQWPHIKNTYFTKKFQKPLNEQTIIIYYSKHNKPNGDRRI
jgi:hypothetical protein